MIDDEIVVNTPEVGTVAPGAEVSTSDFDSTTIEDDSTTVIITNVVPDPDPDPDPDPVDTVIPVHEHEEIIREVRESEGRIHRRIDDLCDEILGVIAVEPEAGSDDAPSSVVEIPAEPEVSATVVEETSPEPPAARASSGRRHKFGGRR